MYTVTYYKLGHRWYLDLPDYIEQGGDAGDLERIGAFHDFLQAIAQGETTLVFRMDTEPFEGADFFELTGSSGGNTGGYYHLDTYNDQPVDYELWFNTVLYIEQRELPSRIYFKRVFLSGS